MQIRRLNDSLVWPLARMLSCVEDTFRPFPKTVDGIASAVRPEDEHWVVTLPSEDVVAYGMLRGWSDGYAVPALGIAVDTFYRRRGLATALMLFLHHRAAERGARQVMLHVDDENSSAKRLYLSMGYRPSEDRWVRDL